MSAIRECVIRLVAGSPRTFGNLTVVPLLQPASISAAYHTFADARAAGMVEITEVSEHGEVPQLRVVNRGDTPVLLVDGDELLGAMQNRIVNLSILVPASATLVIPVSCVEAGRWAPHSREFTESPHTVFARARASKLAAVSESLASHGQRHADQSAVWTEIERKATAMGVSSNTEAMSDIFAHHRDRIEEFVGAIAPAQDQVGAVFVMGGRVAGLDLFDAEEVFRQYHPRLLRSYALDALEHAPGAASNAGAPLDPKAVALALEELLGAGARSYPSLGLGEDIRIRSDRVQGAALVREKKVVHLTAFWNAQNGDWVHGSAASKNQATLEGLMRGGLTAARPGAWLSEMPRPLTLGRERTWKRIEGMLLGLAIGDALGNTSEGMRPGDRERRYGEIRDYLPNHHAEGARVGLPSDDTQLAFWTLEQLLDDGHLDPEHLAARLTREHIFGIGRTVRAFLRDYKDRLRPWQEAGQPSAGNGALMRIAPVIVPHASAPTPALWADAALAGLVTHNDPASIGACVGFVRALWEALSMNEPPPRGWWVRTVCHTMREVEGETRYQSRVPHLPYEGPIWRFTETRVLAALDANLSVREACDQWYSGAYLLETLPSVLYILERHAPDPEEAIVRAVNDTWDNDTVAAIVGSAVGALHGRQGLPGRWVSGLLGRTRAHDDGRVQELVERAWRRWEPIPTPHSSLPDCRLNP